MITKKKSSAALNYSASADRADADAIRLEREGDHENAGHHRGAARHFRDKAERIVEYPPSTSLVMGEAKDGKAIAWRPKDTLYEPDQVALDASAERKEILVDQTLDVAALALDAAQSIEAKNSLEKMLAHQLALVHRMTFDFARRAAEAKDPGLAVKLANVSARLMDSFQHGLLTVQRLRTGNSQTVVVQHVQIQGGQTVVAGSMHTRGVTADGGELEENR